MSQCIKETQSSVVGELMWLRDVLVAGVSATEYHISRVTLKSLTSQLFTPGGEMWHSRSIMHLIYFF